MILILLLPYLLGYVALGVGYLVVGDSGWLWAFVVPAIVAGYVASLRAA